jgi:excisionase family DNA binding protein
MNVDEAILTIRGLADYLRIDEKTVYRTAQAGELPGFKVRRQWRFRRGPPFRLTMGVRGSGRRTPLTVRWRNSPTRIEVVDERF